MTWPLPCNAPWAFGAPVSASSPPPARLDWWPSCTTAVEPTRTVPPTAWRSLRSCSCASAVARAACW
eukprot:5796626-Alexandrium_andersonii.AAC.1